MVERSKSRQTDQEAVAQVTRIFNHANWEVNELKNDFGIDLHVKIFEADTRNDTPWEFYVQVKGRTNTGRRREVVPFSIDWDHLRLWSETSLPILLVVFDITDNAGFWFGVKQYWRLTGNSKYASKKKTKSTTVKIPVENSLTFDTANIVGRYVRNEILYYHAAKVISTINWWIVRNRLAHDNENPWYDDGALLPIGPDVLPTIAFPDISLQKPVLGYCEGCSFFWWMEEPDDWVEEERTGEILPLYNGTVLEPDAYIIEAEWCPNCMDGKGILIPCEACGNLFRPSDRCVIESFIEEYGTQFSEEELRTLCSDCFDRLREDRERSGECPGQDSKERGRNE